MKTRRYVLAVLVAVCGLVAAGTMAAGAEEQRELGIQWDRARMSSGEQITPEFILPPGLRGRAYKNYRWEIQLGERTFVDANCKDIGDGHYRWESPPLDQTGQQFLSAQIVADVSTPRSERLEKVDARVQRYLNWIETARSATKDDAAITYLTDLRNKLSKVHIDLQQRLNGSYEQRVLAKGMLPLLVDPRRLDAAGELLARVRENVEQAQDMEFTREQIRTYDGQTVADAPQHCFSKGAECIRVETMDGARWAIENKKKTAEKMASGSDAPEEIEVHDLEAELGETDSDTEAYLNHTDAFLAAHTVEVTASVDGDPNIQRLTAVPLKPKGGYDKLVMDIDKSKGIIVWLAYYLKDEPSSTHKILRAEQLDGRVWWGVEIEETQYLGSDPMVSHFVLKDIKLNKGLPDSLFEIPAVNAS